MGENPLATGPHLGHDAVHVGVHQDHRLQGITPVMEGSLAWGEARDQTAWKKLMRQYLPADTLASKIPLQGFSLHSRPNLLPGSHRTKQTLFRNKEKGLVLDQHYLQLSSSVF